MKSVQIYFIPAAVIMSVLIGGGYGTGREVVEFFTAYGPTGGLLALCASLLLFSLVLGVSFEFSRVFRVYDYRSFFQRLIGPFWVLFELLYVCLFLLVLGVVSAAAANMLEQRFAVPAMTGLVTMPVLVAFFVLFGRSFVEHSLAIWSVLMYAVFICYFVVIMQQAGTDGLAVAADVKDGWWRGGSLYALYNLAVVPGLLFCTREIRSRRQSIIAAVLAALAVLFPALLFHLSYGIAYPDVLSQALPNYWMIERYAPDWLLLMFLLALFGTLIETGVGLVQSVVERIPQANRSRTRRGLIALLAVSLAAALGSLGIVDLIARGYSLLAYGFAAVYVLPVCTIGIYRLWQADSDQAVRQKVAK